MTTVSMTVNGEAVSADAQPDTLLSEFIRETLNLTGTHVGCDTSQCGSCVVLVDGESAKSCTMLAVQAEGTEVMTVEGLATNGELHPMQKAFHENHALQCGFCTPGFIVSAKALLDQNSDPSEYEIRRWLAGNLCRCTGYDKIVRAVMDSAKKLSNGPTI